MFEGHEGEMSWRSGFICPRPSVIRKCITAKPSEEAETIFLIEDYTDGLGQQLNEYALLESLQREVELLKYRCNVLEESFAIVTPIHTLAPEPFEIIKPFHAVVRFQDEQYIASFFDANISASGDTRFEAIMNLKDVIVGTYDLLTQMDENELGIVPLRQKKVLEEFMQRKD